MSGAGVRMVRTKADRGDARATDPAREDAATCYLCVGAYLDPAFRWMILHRVHNDPGRVIPPSYGFALNPVITHAWIAWGIETTQHAAVWAVLLAGAWSCPAAAGALAGILALWLMLPRALRHAWASLPLILKGWLDRFLRR